VGVAGFRSHVALTVWPIAVLFALGLSHMWPALGGASEYAAASPASWVSLVAASIVLIVFVGAYARGWSRFAIAAADGTGPYRSAGCVKLQKLAGGVAWALLAGHLVAQWVMTIRVGPVALSHYELLRGLLSRPLVLGVYVVGLAALGLYLSQGIAASFRAWGIGTRPETSRWLEVGCTLASAMMMLLAVNVLSHFATGRAYWEGSSPSASSPAQQPRPTDGGVP
jgi:hypothetical protein